LAPPDSAGQNGPVGLVADIDAQHRVEAVIDGADLDHGRNGRHHKPENPQALLAKSLRGAGRER
jgi:hypothetical protein